jgi:hypothetical protein
MGRDSDIPALRLPFGVAALLHCCPEAVTLVTKRVALQREAAEQMDALLSG